MKIFDGNEMVYNAILYDYGRICKYCMLYVVLLIITCIMIMGIGGACLCFYWYTIKNCFNALSY